MTLGGVAGAVAVVAAAAVAAEAEHKPRIAPTNQEK
jgi:hypothetical protein